MEPGQKLLLKEFDQSHNLPLVPRPNHGNDPALWLHFNYPCKHVCHVIVPVCYKRLVKLRVSLFDLFHCHSDKAFRRNLREVYLHFFLFKSCYPEKQVLDELKLLHQAYSRDSAHRYVERLVYQGYPCAVLPCKLNRSPHLLARACANHFAKPPLQKVAYEEEQCSRQPHHFY